MTMTRGEAAPPPKSTVMESTVHPPPAPHSYRDAAARPLQPGMGSPSSSHVKPAGLLVEPSLTPDHVKLLQECFPKRVTISSEKFATSTAAWSNGLIGKCLGREGSAEIMTSALTLLWSTVGEWEMFPMANGYYVFRFSSPEARDEVLFGGPWIVDGAVLALSLFDPAFRPSTDHILRAVLWVRLPELPPGFWSDEIISDILSAVGRVVRLDEHTRLRTRGRFARAAVEVDLRLPLEPGITVDVETGAVAPFWQPFQYENVHLFCLRCRRVGHKPQTCSDELAAPAVVTAPQSPTALPNSMPLPASWATTLMVRRHQRPSPLDGDVIRRRPKGYRDPLTSQSNGLSLGTHLNTDQKQSPLGHTQLHVGSRPTAPTRQSQMPLSRRTPSHVLLRPTPPGRDSSSGATLLPESSDGPANSGPLSGPQCPTSVTSAIGPKPLEPSGSGPSLPAFAEPAGVETGHGGNATDSVCTEEERMIQEILLSDEVNDHDIEFDAAEAFAHDDSDFTLASLKKKKGKGKSREICLRVEPHKRTSKKKVKFGEYFGEFSLLQDLMGDATADEIAAKYGPTG